MKISNIFCDLVPRAFAILNCRGEGLGNEVSYVTLGSRLTGHSKKADVIHILCACANAGL